MEGWQLIMVFFVILMVVRIVPRIIRQRKMQMQRAQGDTNQPFLSEPKPQPFVKEAKVQSFTKETKPE